MEKEGERERENEGGRERDRERERERCEDLNERVAKHVPSSGLPLAGELA